jgi:phosphoribosylanthranilate isomerase
MVRVKICGITRVEDALQAVGAGADALGFVFHGKSSRYVSPELAKEIIGALPPFVQTIGLFVNVEVGFVNEIADRCGLDMIQLHGDEPPEYCELVRRRVIKAFRVRDMKSLDAVGNYRVAGILLDAYSPHAYGGTGQTFDWEFARSVSAFGPIILAGGLTPDNVREAVSRVAPYAVDVSSGVESAPGRKDPGKVSDFIRQVKGILNL